jgi:hypothetical protein
MGDPNAPVGLDPEFCLVLTGHPTPQIALVSVATPNRFENVEQSRHFRLLDPAVPPLPHERHSQRA